MRFRDSWRIRIPASATLSAVTLKVLYSNLMQRSRQRFLGVINRVRNSYLAKFKRETSSLLRVHDLCLTGPQLEWSEPLVNTLV
jgi:hypothetical protein